MNEDRVFYIYEHWRPDRDECFYVGKGKGRRAYGMRQRNRWHQFIQEKMIRLGTSVEIKIVFSGLTEGEAFALEVERIALWKSDGADLVNMTDGGEGASGCKKSLENRKKQSILMKGAPKSEEHKRKIGEAHLGKSPSVKYKCRPRTKEHLKNLSRALRGRVAWNKGKTGVYTPEMLQKMSANTRAQHEKKVLAERDD